MTEDALRTIEAFLMCARHNHLPVQFNLFAFLPENLGGENPYLDPVAWQAQAEYVTSIAQSFHAVPFLAWDLINEPSANANLWRTQPTGDAFEQAAWRKWLAARYPDQPALLDAWAEPSFGIGRNLQLHPTTSGPETAAQDPFALPAAGAFGFDAVRSGYNPLKVYDYFLFTQSIFADWVQRTRDLIRAQGSTQLITVGQEENGVSGRLSPAFYSQLHRLHRRSHLVGLRRHPLGVSGREIPRQAHAHPGNRRAAPAHAGRPPPPHRRRRRLAA